MLQVRLFVGLISLAVLAGASAATHGADADPGCYACTVEIFSDNEAEGRTYHGSATTSDDATGTWTLSGAVVGPNVTATVAHVSGDTSRFAVLLPLGATSATVLGGTWNFSAASTGNRVEISLSGLPPEGLGASDITVAFDSAVLQITSCDTGALSGVCNSNAPGGPARAAGFAAPAITIEPVIIAGLIFDCVAAGAASSTLTITINELVDGTAGTAQPIPATVENGTVTCASSDSDGDGVPDGQDNCPAWPNPSQNLPPWTVPAGDADCDSFTDAIETFVGTDPNDPCANTAAANDEADDRWPADTNDNQLINVFDVVPYIAALNSVSPGPSYTVRLDLNASNNINTFDLVPFIQVLNKACSP